MSTPRFKVDQVREWANRYHDSDDDDVVKCGLRAKAAGRYCRADFLLACSWKSQRNTWCQHNSEQDISEITHVALTTPAERLRIGALMCLEGIGWPTASVLLHFAHSDLYPILDVRALWSLGLDEPSSYSFEFWWKYVEMCRTLARDSGVNDMRTLDRALWQYSKEREGKLS